METNGHFLVHFDRKISQFVGVNETLIQDLSKTYPHVNVKSEFMKMRHWLLHTQKGIHRNADMGFICHWLNNVIMEREESTSLETPLGSYIADYLKGLWKNREHVLALNSL